MSVEQQIYLYFQCFGRYYHTNDLYFDLRYQHFNSLPGFVGRRNISKTLSFLVSRDLKCVALAERDYDNELTNNALSICTGET